MELKAASANSQQGPEALCPAACQKLNVVYNHMSVGAKPSPGDPHIRLQAQLTP